MLLCCYVCCCARASGELPAWAPLAAWAPDREVMLWNEVRRSLPDWLRWNCVYEGGMWPCACASCVATGIAACCASATACAPTATATEPLPSPSAPWAPSACSADGLMLPAAFLNAWRSDCSCSCPGHPQVSHAMARASWLAAPPPPPQQHPCSSAVPTIPSLPLQLHCHKARPRRPARSTTRCR